MNALRVIAGLVLAALLIFAACVAYLALERWPEGEPEADRMPEGWQPNPRTVVYIV